MIHFFFFLVFIMNVPVHQFVQQRDVDYVSIYMTMTPHDLDIKVPLFPPRFMTKEFHEYWYRVAHLLNCEVIGMSLINRDYTNCITLCRRVVMVQRRMKQLRETGVMDTVIDLPSNL